MTPAAYHLSVNTFTFNGGDQFLRRAAQQLREAPQRVRADVCREVERDIKAQLDSQFREGRDPFGRAYPPPKDGRNPPMVRSGALWRGLIVRATADGDAVRIEVISDQEYAGYLQKGTRKMVPRLITPGNSLIAPAWRDAYTRAAKRALDRWIGGTL